MTASTAPSTPTAPAAEPSASAAARARGLIEPQLQVLGRLAEAGLNLALAIERQATAEPAEAPPRDLALAYGRVARAVRLTVALQAKLIKELQALDEVAIRDRARERAVRQQLEDARKARVGRIVERVIVAGCSDDDEVDRLADEASERLEHDEIYGELADRSFSEIIALVCRDLGLAPDWASLAQEAWAQDEIRSGLAAAPLAALAREAAPAAASTPEQPATAGPFRPTPQAASP